MAADEIMVYSAMALVPIVSAIGAFFLVRTLRQKTLSVILAYTLFVIAMIVGMLASFTVVWIFSDLLHGDGALAIIAAPITGAILTIPVVIVFTILLVINKTR